MPDFTKKQLNRVQAAAYQAFKAEFPNEEFKSLFPPHRDWCNVYRISDKPEAGTNVKLVTVQYRTQINDESLRKWGFNPDSVKIEHLFIADRKCKILR